MRMSPAIADENRIAQEIVSVLPAGSVARLCCDDADAIRYAVAGSGMKLRSIVLKRPSLRRLIDDPAREVKVEYLQRDLLRSMNRRAEFRYPHPVRLVATARIARRLTAAKLSGAAAALR